MKILSHAWTFWEIDRRNIHRDPMLRWMIVLPLLLSPGVYWGIPAGIALLKASYNFDLAQYNLLISSFLILSIPGIYGTVIGFLLLDQKDDLTLSAIQITPASLDGYLAYRLILPTLFSIVFAVTLSHFFIFVEMSWQGRIVSGMAAAPIAAMYAIILAAVAKNKVQGFAVQKALGIILLPAFIGYFFVEPYQFWFGLAPTYWPVKVFWAFYEENEWKWLYFFIAIIFQTVTIWALARKFQRNIQV